ncbi:MAG TPA: polyphosphate:AMP phosphotransferase [Vicinamibacteria bacterium]|nr:polyphosphate:AMP phosphotransferase [Vicinamibacteria bacterium]
MLETVELGRVASKEEYAEKEPVLRVGLLTVQYELRESDFPVMIVLGGDDVSGCSEVLNLLHEWMDPRYLEANVYEERSQEETERPLFWRYWRALPPAGRIGLFAREWTHRAVVERAVGDIDEVELDRRLRHIRSFERTLTDNGTLILKLWLHAPRKRIERSLGGRARGESAVVLRHYKGVRAVSERVLARTSQEGAIWNLVESTDPRYRNVTVAQMIISTLARRLGESPRQRPRPPRLPTGPSPITVLDRVDLTKRLEKDAYERKLQRYWRKLAELGQRAHELGKSGVLAFEGWDAAGKGGAIRRITKPMDAAYYRVVPIAAPTDEERSHHYLWRFWRMLPRAGHVVIFDRSWYGRVLVERLEGLASEPEWNRAYAEINDFEEQLGEHGILLLKFWLHVSPEEQLRRFKAREKVPFKKYKISADDYRNREKWIAYEEAADEMIRRTSTVRAPWHLVAADDKRWARIEVLKTLCRRMAKAVGRSR